MKEGMLRTRPYDGQPHTDFGKRGSTLVEGLTFRDVMDCFVRGWIMAANDQVPELYAEALKGTDAHLSTNDLFAIPSLDKVDPLAAWQNMSCEMEKVMGIYPNVFEITCDRVAPFPWNTSEGTRPGASRLPEPPEKGGDGSQGTV